MDYISMSVIGEMIELWQLVPRVILHKSDCLGYEQNNASNHSYQLIWYLINIIIFNACWLMTSIVLFHAANASTWFCLMASFFIVATSFCSSSTNNTLMLSPGEKIVSLSPISNFAPLYMQLSVKYTTVKDWSLSSGVSYGRIPHRGILRFWVGYGFSLCAAPSW